jgi:phytoene dehydrogenase-like protein
MGSVDVNGAMGRVGLPEPIAELAARDWDAVVVGGGHNGLTAAAYMARAGQSVLVLERREQLGGACTLERPFEDEGYVVSPCAYAVGLLDQRVVDELALRRHGYRVFPTDPGLWCPFADGSSVAEFRDGERTRAYLLAQGVAEREVEGLLAYEHAYDRCRVALRKGERDAWEGSSPSREELERMLGGDEELIGIVFEESVVDMLARYVSDPRLVDALFGQGIIGTAAGPRDPGTASIRLMHAQGELEGRGSTWGYVEGGMGRVSFAIAQAAGEAGATLAAGVPVAGILPGEGVELESGELVRARSVISNADPKRVLAMVEPEAMPPDFRERLEAWRVPSSAMKLNAGLKRLPTFTAATRPEAGGVAPHRAMVTITPGLEAGEAAFRAFEQGEPALGFAELYFHTAYDPTVAPEGRHTMSAFCQYAPYELAEGDWDSRRDEIAAMILDAIAAHAPDLHDCVEFVELLGPPDIESRVGLTGGNIFQGEALPDQMWEHRLDHRTPIEGLYLCGAATHPAGSVIGLNGRNAAMAVLQDAGMPAPT